jgi:glutamyl-tRNA synthetase
MEVTHVLRAQEFISSVPKYIALHELLGWQMPINAITPPVLDETGKRKLSKRYGALPILEYRNRGFLPEAMCNFLALLGWNDGTEQEIFSREELIEKFSLDRVQRSGARFDDQRLEWMNGQWIRSLSVDELYQRSTDFWPAAANTADESFKKNVLALAQDRMKTLADLPVLTEYFFSTPTADMSLITTNKQLKKLETPQLKDLLRTAKEAIEASEFTEAALTNTLNGLLEKTGQKPGVLFSLIRISVTWAPFSPGLAETLVLLGKEATIARIDTALTSIT